MLVTGATGFIGWRLSQVLVALGANVTGVSRSASVANLPTDVQPLAIDLTERESVNVALGSDRYDAVVHLAGHVTGRPHRELVMPTLYANLIGTVNLLDAISSVGCGRFVYSGSSEEPRVNDVPKSPYAAAKSSADAYVRMFHALFGVPAVVLRLFLTYGPRQESSKLVPFSIHSLRKGSTPSLLGPDNSCDAIYVDDVVRCILKAVVAPPGIEGATFDVGSGSSISLRELVRQITQLMGLPASNIPALDHCLGANTDRPACIEDTKASLGWAPVWTLHDGLSETIRWHSNAAMATGNTQ